MDGYLQRIGANRPARADAAALRDLQLRHLRTVPFENLSVHLGEEIVLEEKALVAKIVDGRRGGLCYEANGAFAVLLRHLGFTVSLLPGRVHGSDGRLGIPYDHLALLVEPVDGSGRWLVDVGFGEHAHYPLAFDEREEQPDPAGSFRIVETGEHGDLDVYQGGRPQFRLENRPHELADFRAGAWWHSTSPASHFTKSLVCTRLTTHGRITLSGRKLVTTEHGERQERLLSDDASILAAYRDHFGIRLDRVPPDPRETKG
ncbi:arylamine N-acetyltransferase family protein [Streptomyces albipurpureus]|uniref:Arylamine N-acetyltransferase n=1 Tax=Streptomyces albipurpureus TaxID=2897419 RepID=A0ABT0UJQ2_9ACTN|nr:arylamine N-acetyltransferase [Streptomyces sp. CWNU-1]MCM2388487.1 arylamine N-acetyltransferase [Streptomyces sp. CWNU-1]